ncbi:MAG: hypothetical protein R3A10_08375 [Caldilineaceae bacterium]
MQLDRTMLQEYLSRRHGAQAEIRRVQQLRGEVQDEEALKQFSYGDPVLIEYTVDGQHVREVLHRIRRTPFGRERSDDRVAAIWLDYQTFNKLPRHVPAADILAHLTGNGLTSLASADELMLVTGYRPGHVYADDLIRLRDGGDLRDVDVARAEALAAYLAEIHLQQHDDPALWRRRLRDLIGHGEGVMGDRQLPGRLRLGRPGAPAPHRRGGQRLALAAQGAPAAAGPGPRRFSSLQHPLRHRQHVLRAGPSSRVGRAGRRCEMPDHQLHLLCSATDGHLRRRLPYPVRPLLGDLYCGTSGPRSDRSDPAVVRLACAGRRQSIWYPSVEDDVRRKLLDFCENVLARPAPTWTTRHGYWQDAT